MTDPQGAVVAGALVSARQIDTAVSVETTTDDSGRFRFPYLRVAVRTLGCAGWLRAGHAPPALTLGSAFDIPS